MPGIIDLTFIQLILSYIFLLLVMVIVKIKKIKLEQSVIIASLRMTVQLMLVGYILVYVLANPHPGLTVLIIVIMEAFAVYTVFSRFKNQLSFKLKKIVTIAFGLGTLICLLFFLLVIVHISPWYDPRYFIPTAGMFIGNSMTAMSLGVKSLLENMNLQNNMVEEALILGATPQTASQNIINTAFDSAIIPTINSMVGMGIVFLPGMMTGQILSGVAPTTAISYQIAFMLGVLGSIASSSYLMLQWGYKTFFNTQAQFINSFHQEKAQ